MNHKTEPYTNVPELRQQLMEKWYQDEWPAQEKTPRMATYLHVLTPMGYLRRLISAHLNRPARNSQPTTPRSELETRAAQ